MNLQFRPTDPEWSLARVQSYIKAQIPETHSLDYGESGALGTDANSKKELVKNVTAMANSDGGTLIYGVKENGHIPTTIDAGVDPNVISKEWIENLLIESIRPKLSGLRIHQLNLVEGQPGPVIYVIEVPKTEEGGPHQSVLEHRYYRRYNFRSSVMEDFEIRDAMRRSLGPNLTCEFRIPEQGEKGGPEEQHHFGLLMNVRNNSETPALYAHFQLLVDSRLIVANARGFRAGEAQLGLTIGNQAFQVRTLNLPWAVPKNLPIWRGDPFTVNEQPLVFAVEDSSTDKFVLFARLSAPHMDIKTLGFVLAPLELESKRRVLAISVETAVGPS